MATAIESDGEQQQQINSETDKIQEEKTMISAVSGGTQALETGGKRSGGGPHNGLSFHDLCCTSSTSCANSMYQKRGVATKECNAMDTTGGGNGFSQESQTSCSSSSPMVPLLSEYYTHIIGLQREMERLSVPAGDLRASLEEGECLIGSNEKQVLFRNVPGEDNLTSLFTFLQDHSSWYNHFLHSQISTALTPAVGSSCQDLINQYTSLLDQYSQHKLLLLPAVSTGPQCPQGFEELRIFTSKPSDSYTLGETLRFHESLSVVLGIKKEFALLQGVVKEFKRGGGGGREESVFLFWIPSSVASVCLSTVAGNVYQLSSTGITRIEGKYGTAVTPPDGAAGIKEKLSFMPSFTRRYQADSGFGETNGSVDNLLSSLSSPFPSTINPSDDDVFITQLHSDTSSSNAATHYSIATSNISSNSSIEIKYNNNNNTINGAASCESVNSIIDQRTSCSTPVLSPPPGYEHESVLSESSSDLSSSVRGEVGGEREREDRHGEDSSEGVIKIGQHTVKVIDSEILNELDRQNGHPLPSFDQDTASTQEGSSVTTPKTPVSKTLSTESTYVKMGSAQVHYITQPLKAQLIKTSETTPTIDSQQRHRLQVTPTKQAQYVMIPNMEVHGFVKRVLLRSDEAHPAMLHMISISARNRGGSDILTVRPGQKLLARYIEDGYIIATDIATGRTGKVLYSSARLSRSYYGDNSKISSLSYSSLFSLSSLNVKQIVDNQDSFRQFQPIKIDLIVIKDYISQDRDEMTVTVGNKLRLLYGDERWIYGSSLTGQTGFIPRSHCRLTRQSSSTLQKSGWLYSTNIQFQSDYKFNSSLPPPISLLENPNLPQPRKKGEICSLLGNYTVPGTQQLVRKGCNVKVIYSELESHYFYVATISGLRFWIPAKFLTVAGKSFEIPKYLRRSSEDLRINTARLRPKPHTISGQEYRGKKVSFALQNQMTIISSARSSLCQSNPELSQEPQYSTIGQSATNGGSSETPTNTVPSFFYFDDNSPADHNCCKLFCF